MSTSRRSTDPSEFGRIAVHVTPRSAHDEIVGWQGRELRVRVTVPPADGRANIAVCNMLAHRLGVPARAVTIVRGHASRHKSVEIAGMSTHEIAGILGEPDDPAR